MDKNKRNKNLRRKRKLEEKFTKGRRNISFSEENISKRSIKMGEKD